MALCTGSGLQLHSQLACYILVFKPIFFVILNFCRCTLFLEGEMLYVKVFSMIDYII